MIRAQMDRLNPTLTTTGEMQLQQWLLGLVTSNNFSSGNQNKKRYLLVAKTADKLIYFNTIYNKVIKTINVKCKIIGIANSVLTGWLTEIILNSFVKFLWNVFLQLDKISASVLAPPMVVKVVHCDDVVWFCLVLPDHHVHHLDELSSLIVEELLHVRLQENVRLTLIAERGLHLHILWLREQNSVN